MKKCMQMVVTTVANGFIVRPVYKPGEEMNANDWYVFRDSSELNFWLQEIEQERQLVPARFFQ